MRSTRETGSIHLRRRLLLRSLVAAGLSGCATTTIDGLQSFAPATLKDADLVPTSTDGAKRTRVVVIPSDESPTSRGANLPAIATTTLETILGTGGVEVIDRRLATMLDKELAVIDSRGAGSYGGPDIADYAIRVVLGNAGWGSTHIEPSTYTDKKTGKSEYIPGGYMVSGSSKMTLRIYALPSLKLVETLPLEGSASSSKQPSAPTASEGIGMVRAATEQGIISKRNVVLNEFSPKGYITDKRVKDKLAIFRVKLGKSTGTKPGDTVEIWTMLKAGDSFDEVSLGRGRVSNIVSAEGSWIIVEDEKIAAQVRKYDYVKVRRSTGFFD